MAFRTYFNDDHKPMKQISDRNKFIEEQQVLKKQAAKTVLLVKDEQQKQLWDLDLTSLYKSSYKQDILHTDISKKRQYKSMPGSKFIKVDEEQNKTEENEKTKLKEELLADRELKQIVYCKTKEFWLDVQQQQKDKKQQDQQNDKNDDKIVQETDPNNNQENEPQNEQKQQQEVNKIDKPIKKSKLIKGGQSNFVRQDLTNKYKDRFRGALYMNRKMYKPNGKLKNPVRATKEQSKVDFQITNNMGRFENNIYVQSISDALLIDILEEDPEIEEQQKLAKLEINRLGQEILENLDNQTKYLELLKLAFGFDEFREGQFEAIQTILKGQSALMVQKTGHGKSLVYQFLSLIKSNQLGIVFSPLVALMLDQITKLPQSIPGVAYHSMLTSFQKEKIFQLVKDRQVRLLFCSPEIFQSDLGFLIDEMGPISFVCIDEAHCVSELSHSFRHTYFVLDQMIKQFLKESTPPYLAITATATHKTVKSIQEKFNIDKSIIAISTERPNLHLTVSRDKDSHYGLVKLMQSNKFKYLNSIIIYCRSRYMVEVISNYLTNSNFKCCGFHAQLDENDKLDIVNKFMSNKIQIIVATSVFAMGIDKSDVRAVIHLNMPKSMEAYLQEIGRAGRDGLPAYCHMFLNERDFHMERTFIMADAPDKYNLKILFEIMNRWNILSSNQIKYLVAKQVEEQLDIRKDNVYTLMRILEKCSNGGIRVYPICHERILLKFFKESVEEVKQKCGFIKLLCGIGRVSKGVLQVNVIKASNFMGIHPLELIRQARHLFNDYQISCDVQDEIFPFQFVYPQDQDTNTSTKMCLDDIQDVVFEYSERFKQNQLDKLNILYLTSYEQSYPNVEVTLQNDDRIKWSFDLYFTAEDPMMSTLSTLYGTTDVVVDELLPFDHLGDRAQSLQILINRFIGEQTANLNDKQVAKKKQELQKSPRILAGLLCGVQSVKYSYKDYKNTCIWNKALRLKYEEVSKLVLSYLVKQTNEQQEQEQEQEQELEQEQEQEQAQEQEQEQEKKQVYEQEQEINK